MRAASLFAALLLSTSADAYTVRRASICEPSRYAITHWVGRYRIDCPVTVRRRR